MREIVRYRLVPVSELIDRQSGIWSPDTRPGIFEFQRFSYLRVYKTRNSKGFPVHCQFFERVASFARYIWFIDLSLKMAFF